MGHKSTIYRRRIYTGGKKVPGLTFQGEVMKCLMCGTEQRSDPAIESQWTYIEADGKGYYICPAELPGEHGLKIQFELAYAKIFKKIAEQPR